MARGALDELADTDRWLEQRHGKLRSLRPGAERATALAEIGERHLDAAAPPEVASAFAASLSDIARSMSDSFPQNVFWDLDYPAARLFDYATSDADGVGPRLDDAGAMISSLQRTYGRESSIQFQYAHDFTYGFDWAKWVQRDRAERGELGPFAPEFLAHLVARGHELLALISKNDATYPTLPEGEARNPFGFRRDATSEEALLRDLAERKLVPVEAWRVDAKPDWRRPYAELRKERARALNLSTGA